MLIDAFREHLAQVGTVRVVAGAATMLLLDALFAEVIGDYRRWLEAVVLAVLVGISLLGLVRVLEPHTLVVVVLVQVLVVRFRLVESVVAVEPHRELVLFTVAPTRVVAVRPAPT